MTLDLVSFTTIAGVPATPVPRKIGRAFLATLETALEQLWKLCPWGPARRIIHGGAYVQRPDPNMVDRHAQARAIDVMHFEWDVVEVGPAMVLLSPTDLRRYLAVTAVLELGIGCTLNYWQPDAKHKNHWHLDDHRSPGWSPGWMPQIRHLQASLIEFWDHQDIKIDGVYGPRTRAAAEASFGDLADPTVWRDALLEISRRGFAPDFSAGEDTLKIEPGDGSGSVRA